MISFINKGVSKLHTCLLNTTVIISGWVKFLIVIGALAVYGVCIIFLGDIMKVAVNYFVLIPMFVSAIMFGFWGGVVSGVLALPANLVLFYLFGDITYAPISKLTAFFAGLVTGIVLGYLSGFYQRLQIEIRDHKEARKLLDSALEQKQLLLKETHHRIKNNLAIILGIIELEMLEEKDDHHTEFLENLVQRIRSVATTQNLLYGIENISKIDMKPFLSKLIDQVKKGISLNTQNIEIVLDVEDLFLIIDEALPLGLIIHETCTNSIKYAFQHTDHPRIDIILREEDNEHFLTIRDNGTGLPEEVIACGSDSLGINLVEKLVRQMNAECTFENDNGAILNIRLKKQFQNGKTDSPETSVPRMSPADAR